jgi:hypothetical protein
MRDPGAFQVGSAPVCQTVVFALLAVTGDHVPMTSRGYRDEWDDRQSGGTPCACGRTCAEGDYAGNPRIGPRSFCDTDRGHIGAVIRGLPETYVELRLKLARSQQLGERVSGSRETSAPLDLAVEAFMRHIILVTVSWEEQVRAMASLAQIPTGATRDGAALARGCRLLGGEPGYLGALLSLGPEVKNRPVPGSRQLREIEPGTVIRIDSAGDAWQQREMDGTAAGLEFLSLNGRARAILGLSLQRRRVAVRCDGCDGLTLVQREALGGGWEPVVKCTACPQSYLGAQFELFMGRGYAAGSKAAKAS